MKPPPQSRMAIIVLSAAAAACIEVAGVRRLTLIEPDSGPSIDAPGDAGEDAPRTCADCGKCAHDCLGGDCVRGLCAPVQLASIDPGGVALAVDATTLYWSTVSGNQGVIRSIPKMGGAVVDLKITPALFLAIAIDGTLYYITHADVLQDAVIHCLRADCATQTLVAQSNGSMGELAVYGQKAYWTLGPTIVGGDAPDANPGAPTKIIDLTTSPLALAVDESSIYWIDPAGLWRCPRADCRTSTSEVLAARPGSVRMQSTATELLLTVANDGGAVVQIDKQSRTQLPLTERAGYPTFVVGDSRRVFWIDRGAAADGSGSRVMACNRAPSCQPAVLALTPDPPVALVQDDTALYWLTLGGAVVRLAK